MPFEKEFIDAAKQGDLNSMKDYLAKGVNIHFADNYDNTALLWAAHYGYIMIVKWLLEENNLSITEKNKDNSTAVMLAAERGHFTVVKYLVDERKANFKESNKYGNTVFLLAANGGYLDMAKWLSEEKGVDINQKNNDGTTGVMLAAERGHFNLVKYLIDERKADYQAKNRFGNTVFLLAANGGYVDMMKWLIEVKKANVKQKNEDGTTAIMLAANKGHISIVKMLANEKEVDLDEKNHYGNTVIRLAVGGGYFDIVKWLVEERKVNLHIKTSNGETAYDVAKRKKYQAIVEYLAPLMKQNDTVTQTPQVVISMMVSSEDLQTQEVLGEGSYGITYKGIWEGSTVAIKKLKLHQLSENTLKEFMFEAQLMSQLKHPNIVTFYKLCSEPNNYSIVMEYCVNGCLFQWLKKPEAESWPMRIRIGIDIGKGLHHLHNHHILHRDLKSLNILLDNQLTAKITDFGLSKVKTETLTATTQGVKGTMRWLAPEIINGEEKHHSEKTDVYAYGMVLWEIAARKVPYQEEANEMIVANWIGNGRKEDIPNDTPYSLAKLIEKCWEKRAEKRPIAKVAYEELEAARHSHVQTPAAVQPLSSGYQANLASEQKADTTFNKSGYRQNLMS